MSQQLNSSRLRKSARRLSGYLVVLAALLITSIAQCAQAQAACNVVYTISSQWNSGFGAGITIQNTGTTAWTSWTLTWTFANGQTISQLWNGTETQSGANVTVKSLSYNGSIPAGGSYAGMGFNGTWNGITNAVPASFAVNGTTCGAVGSFTLKPSAATLSVAQGASGTDTISVTDVSPFAGSVSFTASGMPSGVTASFSPTASTTSSVLTLTASSTATAGNYTITVTGTSGSLTETTAIALTVTAKVPPSFTIALASPLSITQGKTTTDTVTITDAGGFTGNVTLTISGLPSGVTCTFGTNPVTTTSVLTCTASATAAVGPFTATINGTSGTTTATISISGTVVSSTGSFTIAASPTTCTMPQGGSCTVTITVTDLNGFTGTVTISASGLPSGVTLAGVTNPTATTEVLTFAASTTATVGTSNVTLTGTSGTLNATTSITMVITAGGSFSLKSSAAALSVAPGTSATDTITITDVSPFSGSVTLVASGLPTGYSASFSPNPATSTSVMTITLASGATATTGTITVTGTSGTLSSATTIPLTVTGSGGSFTLAPSAPALTIGLDAGSTDTINVIDAGGFTGAVTLTASGMPSGVTAAFATNPTTGSSLLTLTASSSATTGPATITIQGTSTGTSAGTLAATTTIALTVSATPLVQIAWVSPAAGIAGSTFTVMPGVGASFAETQGSSVIKFGTTTATVTTWAIDSVAVTVPGLAAGTYNVTAVVGGVTSNPVPFTITSAAPSPEVYTGNSTWFSSLGSPYGGCGVPQANIDSQNFVALNVQNDPGNYTLTLSRPISTTGPDASDIGLWNNGLNCGRWVHITMGSNCEGTNDGNQDESFCRGGVGWVPDQFNGAQIDSVVADSCQDENAWCRDDPYHLDQAQAALNNYTLNGAPAGDMYPNYWNNRQISWYFEPAPNYTGDINIGFLTGANAYWSAISITHLPNGIHGVQYMLNGVWTTAVMDADLGDDYIVLPTVAGGTQYEIQVFDVTNTLINSGRIYSFSYPASCGSSCTPALTPITYTTSQ